MINNLIMNLKIQNKLITQEQKIFKKKLMFIFEQKYEIDVSDLKN